MAIFSVSLMLCLRYDLDAFTLCCSIYSNGSFDSMDISFVPNVHEIFVQLQIARGMTSGHLHLPGFHGRLLFLPFSLSSSSCFISPNVYARSVEQDMRLSIARFMILWMARHMANDWPAETQWSHQVKLYVCCWAYGQCYWQWLPSRLSCSINYYIDSMAEKWQTGNSIAAWTAIRRIEALTEPTVRGISRNQRATFQRDCEYTEVGLHSLSTNEFARRPMYGTSKWSRVSTGNRC